jgi:ABC-type transport system involved in cytochrome c biogenesis ATPase subunit
MLYFQDLQYSHLLYNTFGPVTCTIKFSTFTKIQTNNGTGKTIFLKTLIGLLIPKKGIIINNYQKSMHCESANNRLSNSQSKKFKMLLSINNKMNVWIFDEPYSFLDITSIIFYKKKIINHLSKNGTIIFTDCIRKTILPSMIYYSDIKYI